MEVLGLLNNRAAEYILSHYDAFDMVCAEPANRLGSNIRPTSMTQYLIDVVSMTHTWESEETDFAALAEKALSHRDVLRQVEHLHCRRAMLGIIAVKVAPSAVGYIAITSFCSVFTFAPSSRMLGTAESGRGAARVDTEDLTATCPHFPQV